MGTSRTATATSRAAMSRFRFRACKESRLASSGSTSALGLWVSGSFASLNKGRRFCPANSGWYPSAMTVFRSKIEGRRPVSFRYIVG
jgi:hypothetical protein